MTSSKTMLLLPAALLWLANMAYGIKVGAFNIQHFGDAKVANVGREIARVLAGYDIVLVQEVRDVDQSSLKALRSLLGATVWDYISSIPLGRTTYKERYVFFYKKAALSILGSFQYNDSVSDIFEREPYAVLIRYSSPVLSRNVSIVLQGLHTQPERAFEELQALPDAITAAQTYFASASGVIALGDFNADCSYLSNTKKLLLPIFTNTVQYQSLISDTADTTTSVNTDCAYDRIVVQGSNDVVANYTRVYRYDVELGINASITAAISDHYPVDFKLL